MTNEERDDAPEEPEMYWYINPEGEIGNIFIEADGTDGVNASKAIGDYFETKEEAELAVRKLKAWKRLKDKGFRFEGGDAACISYKTDIENWSMQDLQDFAIIFGGEE